MPHIRRHPESNTGRKVAVAVKAQRPSAVMQAGKYDKNESVDSL